MSSTIQLPNGVVVMTIVYPSTGAGGLLEKQEPTIPKEIADVKIPRETQDPNNPRQTTLTAWLKDFIKREQKTLGAIQIIIGLISMLFGIPHALNYISVATISGVLFWGGLLYIVSGSLTVSNDKQTNVRKAKKTLVMNVVSATVALVAVILLIVDAAVCLPLYYGYYCYYNYARSPALNAIMIIFCLLEDFIAISLSVHGFKTSSSSRCCLPQPITIIETPDAFQTKQDVLTPPCCMVSQPGSLPYSDPTPLLKNEAVSPDNESSENSLHLPAASPLLSQNNNAPVVCIAPQV